MNCTKEHCTAEGFFQHITHVNEPCEFYKYFNSQMRKKSHSPQILLYMSAEQAEQWDEMWNKFLKEK